MFLSEPDSKTHAAPAYHGDAAPRQLKTGTAPAVAPSGVQGEECFRPGLAVPCFFLKLPQNPQIQP